MRIKETKVYQYDELNSRAQERAREWFLRDWPLEDWWESVYEDVATVSEFLGINLRQKAVKLMNGKRRYDPAIYFSGFSCQGSGSSYNATWRAQQVQADKVKEHAPQDTELHRLVSELASVAHEFPFASAQVQPARRDNSICVSVDLSDEDPEYYSDEAAAQADQKRADAIAATEEALKDFNQWIYQQLEKAYEWLTSDEQVEESIRADAYEFDEDGRRV